MARRAVDEELSREMIMDAARELFVAEGYRHVTMRKIANRLGYSHGALHYHFKNKVELFQALVAQDFALLDQKLEEVVHKEGLRNWEKLRNVLLGFIEFGVTHPHHYELMFLTNVGEVADNRQLNMEEGYRQFADAIHTLYGERITTQTIWFVFLSLHGFVSHYCYSATAFNELRPTAVAHVHFLLQAMQ